MSLLSPSQAPSIAQSASGSSSRAADYEMDPETSALIAKLALEDLVEAFNSRKGKSRADSPPTDEEVAFELQCLHYQQIITLVEDEKMAKSIADAVSTDEAYVAALVAAEEAAEADRRAAEMLSRGEPMPEQSPAQARVENPAFVMHPDPPSSVPPAMKAAGKQPETSSDLEEEESVAAELLAPSAASAPKNQKYPIKVHVNGTAGPSVNRHKTVECTICTEELRSSSALHTPCDHYYCRPCVVSLIEHFVRDESLFPLRCCQERIPVTDVVPFITSSLNKTFQEKHAEFSILSKDRVYCVTPSCSKFLGSAEGIIGSQIFCADCWTSTCSRCKQTAHKEDDCPVNRSTVELRALARREGWQTCPGCQTLVELDLGCYHMTCLCRSEFCYLCAAPWKNCECPQWEEARLLATAQQRVENELGARAVRNMVPEQMAAQVQEMVETLRVNHNCERHNWRYRPGGGRCEQCHFNLPNYLLVCRGCSILACVRCSRNRL